MMVKAACCSTGTVRSGIGYEEVEAVQDFMDWCDDEDEDEGYRFIRLGEGLDDPADIRGRGFEALHVQRSVTY